jgi:hypothetical protein
LIDTSKIWSRISHPHILRMYVPLHFCKRGLHSGFHEEFLGANVLDTRPFIVTPLLVNGNVRMYLQTHPECDRLKIVSALGLFIFVSDAIAD